MYMYHLYFLVLLNLDSSLIILFLSYLSARSYTLYEDHHELDYIHTRVLTQCTCQFKTRYTLWI